MQSNEYQNGKGRSVGSLSNLVAPFPWYGGKRRWAKSVNARLGKVDVYVEPFAGSLAILLQREPAPREIICDLDGYVVNFWRAIVADPEAVAYWADAPTYHHELTARRNWLAHWGQSGSSTMLESAPDYYDARAAGYWCWCVSNWIGAPADMLRLATNKRPHIGSQGVQAQRLNLPGGVRDGMPQISHFPGGQGVQAQRVFIPGVDKDGIPGVAYDKRPRVPDRTGAIGIQAQRLNLPGGVSDKRSLICHSAGGVGVFAQRLANDQMPLHRDKIPHVLNHPGGRGVQAHRGMALLPWFDMLASRLHQVIALNRDWRSALTDTLLWQTPTCPPCTVGIFLDPPYLIAQRMADMYRAEDGDNPAQDAWAWAVEHGDRHRIAYACHLGDFDPPDGWVMETMSMAAGNRGRSEAMKVDCILYSPACLSSENDAVEQGVLL